MNIKRILFIALCVLLATILVLTGILIFKIRPLLGIADAPAPTVPTAPSETPTEPESTEHVHTYELSDTIAATCDGYGWKVYKCSTCAHTHMPVDERTDPLGHNYESSTTMESTCTEPGTVEEVCTRCGNKTATQKEPLGHNWGHGAVHDATCDAGGYTEFTCMRCGFAEQRDTTEPLGHQLENPVTFPATCTEDAYTASTCAREGCDFVDKVIEVGTATGHTPDSWHALDSGEFAQFCTTCFTPLMENGDDGKTYEILLHPYQALTDENGLTYFSYSVTIGISGDLSAKLFTYTVNDYLCSEVPPFSYQSGLGFVLDYLDQEGMQQHYFVNHKAPLTITIPLVGAPTVE